MHEQVQLVEAEVRAAPADRGQGRLGDGYPDPPGPHMLVLARGPEGYRRLSRQLAAAHLAGGEKGKPRYDVLSVSAQAMIGQLLGLSLLYLKFGDSSIVALVAGLRSCSIGVRRWATTASLSRYRAMVREST